MSAHTWASTGDYDEQTTREYVDCLICGVLALEPLDLSDTPTDHDGEPMRDCTRESTECHHGHADEHHTADEIDDGCCNLDTSCRCFRCAI